MPANQHPFLSTIVIPNLIRGAPPRTPEIASRRLHAKRYGDTLVGG